MSKIKTALSDDFDATDPREPVLPDQPSAEDMLMNDLTRTIAQLNVHIPYGYENELEGLIRVLENVLQHVRKPF